MTESRAKLIVFSPLPPALNGIANYTANLLTELGQRYDCLCVIEDDAPDPEPTGEWEVIHVSYYRQMASQLAHERHLFQLGNNSGHLYMLPWLERVGGVVTLHDGGLSHMLESLAGERRGFEDMSRLLRAAYAGRAAELGIENMENGWWSGICGQEFTCLSLVTGSAAIVHSRTARMRLLAENPAIPTYVVPHFARSDAQGLGRLPSPGRPGGGPVRLLCLGFVSRSKRVDLVLRAMAIWKEQGLKVALTIAGEERPEEQDLEAEVAKLGLQDEVLRLGYVTEDQIDACLTEADVVMNLRFPTSGESSGTVARAMAAGCCVVVSDVGSYSEMPDGTVFKIAADDMRGPRLADQLSPLLQSAGARWEIGKRAASFASRALGLKGVAQDYSDVIEETYRQDIAPRPRTLRKFAFPPPQASRRIARAAARAHALRSPFQLWWRERLLPLSADLGRLEIIGGTDSHMRLAAEAFGWGVGDDIEAVLLLLDEAGAAAPGEELARVWEIFTRLAPQASVTIEILSPSGLPTLIGHALAQLGYQPLREARAPSVPLMIAEGHDWLRVAWCATFARTTVGRRTGP